MYLSPLLSVRQYTIISPANFVSNFIKHLNNEMCAQCAAHKYYTGNITLKPAWDKGL